MLYVADISNVKPEYVAAFCVCFGALLWAVHQGLGIRAHVKGTKVDRVNQPVEIRTSQTVEVETRRVTEYVPRHEFTALASQVENLRREMPAMERRLYAAGEKRACHIHNRIGPLADGVSQLCGQMGIVIQREERPRTRKTKQS